MRCLEIIYCALLMCCDLCLGSLFYPASSAYGIFAAVAVPLELPPRNVFVSYNFEANYNLPQNWDTPPVYKAAESAEDFETGRKAFSSRPAMVHNMSYSSVGNEQQQQQQQQQTTMKKRSSALFTRANIYNILIDKLKRSGFRGKPCLLRLICETSATSLGDINGVLGSLINVIFSPSTSQPEKVPRSYYQAELDGQHNQCHNYWTDCSESFLDLISQPFEEILKLIEQQKYM